MLMDGKIFLVLQIPDSDQPFNLKDQKYYDESKKDVPRSIFVLYKKPQLLQRHPFWPWQTCSCFP